MFNKKRISPKQSIKAELQKEIGSRCPFCRSEDVGHFEFHHIDGKSDNTVIDNLLMLCPQCHSKFTKGEWPLQEAKEKKLLFLKDIDFLKFQSNGGEFDYHCYSMQESDGRHPNDFSNGSILHLNVIDRYHFELKLKHDERMWVGQIVLEQRDYGILFFRYQGNNEFEFGRRECYLKQNYKGDFREDIIFMKPLTDLKDYGNELAKRITKMN